MIERRQFTQWLMASTALAASGCIAQGKGVMQAKASNIKVRKGYLDGPYGQIHYYEAGEGPTLILSHQSPVSARMFERAIPLLADSGLRVIAVDTPGYGNSDTPPAPPSIAEYGECFVAVLDALNLQKAHLLGHHTGAGILASFAVNHPERVSSLILNGPPLLTAEDLKAFADLKHEPHPIYKDGSHLHEQWEQRVRYSSGWTDEVSMHRRLVDQLWAGPTAWFGHYSAFRHDMLPDIKALTGPVLILTNTGDDIYEVAHRVHKLRPDFEFAELEGGTHDIVDEQPEAWSGIVSQYVLRHSE